MTPDEKREPADEIRSYSFTLNPFVFVPVQTLREWVEVLEKDADSDEQRAGDGPPKRIVALDSRD